MPLQQLIADPVAIAIGVLMALVARAASAHLPVPALWPLRQQVPLLWQHLLVLGGSAARWRRRWPTA